MMHRIPIEFDDILVIESFQSQKEEREGGFFVRSAMEVHTNSGDRQTLTICPLVQNPQ